MQSTKFILAGGYIYKADDAGKAFCEELVDGFNEPVKILVCLFARYAEFWDEAFEADKRFFHDRLPHKKIELRLASFDRFTEDVKWADVVYFRGGSSEGLVDSLNGKREWCDHLNGKTVAGSSAGADALAKYYYGLDSREVRHGLHLLDIKVIPHFKSDYHGWEFDWDKAYSDLDNYKEKLPILALPEGHFEIIRA